jgi:hypothetical protein
MRILWIFSHKVKFFYNQNEEAENSSKQAIPNYHLKIKLKKNGFHLDNILTQNATSLYPHPIITSFYTAGISIDKTYKILCVSHQMNKRKKAILYSIRNLSDKQHRNLVVCLERHVTIGRHTHNNY